MNIYQTASGIYYFRTAIPKDLIDVNSPKELHISLRTSNLNVAQKIVDELKLALKSHYIFLRSNNLRFRRDKSIRSTGNIVSDLIASLKVGNTEVTIKSTAEDQNSFSKLVQLVLSLNQGQLPVPTNAPACAQPLPSTPQENSPLAYDVYLKYREMHAKKSSPITAVTYNTYSPYISVLLKGLSLNAIGRTEVAKIREDVRRLPSSKYHKDFYNNNCTIDDVTADMTLITEGTASNVFSIMSTFFSWCVSCCKIDRNPFSGVVIDSKAQQTSKSNVTRYTSEQLKLLFDGENFKKHGFARSFKYWGPLISLYTGMRVAEVGQLHVADVFINKKGRYFLSINKDTFSEKIKKTVKNDHSVRIVPVSKTLIDLGFDRYLETIKCEGYPILFPDLGINNISLIASSRMSIEFCRYKTKVIKHSDSGKLNFHSLRHTFVAYLQHKQITTSLIQQLVGHAHGTITLDLYGEPIDPSELVGIVDSIDYDINVVPWGDTDKQKASRKSGWRKIKEKLG